MNDKVTLCLGNQYLQLLGDHINFLRSIRSAGVALPIVELSAEGPNYSWCYAPYGDDRKTWANPGVFLIRVVQVRFNKCGDWEYMICKNGEERGLFDGLFSHLPGRAKKAILETCQRGEDER